MFEKEMYKLELNKSIGYAEWQITRVPGGWYIEKDFARVKYGNKAHWFKT